MWDVTEMARMLRLVAAEPLPRHLAKMIRAWERGDHQISERYELLYRQIFRAGEGRPGGVFALGSVPVDGDRLEWADRHAASLDARSVDSLAAILAAHRLAEDAMGGPAVADTVRAQMSVIEMLMREARSSIRRPLTSVAMQWAQYTAYLHRDAGDADGDSRYLRLALEWAGLAGDPTMQATVLTQQASLAAADNHPGTALVLAVAAQQIPGVTRGQLADAAASEARIHALAGDEAAAVRKLMAAADHAARLGSPERQPWLYWMTPAYFRYAHGAALVPLADKAPYRHMAVTALTEGYEGLPAGQRTSAWAGRALSYLADAHIHGGDPEQAAAAALRALAIAQATASVRLTAAVASAHARLMARWPGVAAVTELDEALR